MNSLRKYSSLIVWGVIVVFILIFTLVMNNLGDDALQYDDTYYVRNYQVRYEYESGRTFKVTEEITAVFTVSGKHGIIRDLPYNSGETYDDIRSDDIFDTKSSNGFISLYLGDAYQTVPIDTPITYSLEYTFELPASAGNDTVYINLIGGGWTTSIEKAICTLVLPTTPIDMLVNDEDFTGNYSLDGNTVTVTVQELSSFTPVTVQCAFEKGVLGGAVPDAGEITILVIAAILLVTTIVLIAHSEARYVARRKLRTSAGDRSSARGRADRRHRAERRYHFAHLLLGIQEKAVHRFDRRKRSRPAQARQS